MNETTTKSRALLEACMGQAVMEYLNDPSIKEVMLNPNGILFIEKPGKGVIQTEYQFQPVEVERMIKVIAGISKQPVTAKKPTLSVALPFFMARFQGWLPPACTSPAFCIRKHTRMNMKLEDWVADQGMPEKVACYLSESVLAKKNIIICGGTGSGKTTLTNSLLGLLGNDNERVILIEDTAELYLHGNNHVSLLAIPPLTIHDCLKGALRMRPDRIIIGEVRDGAALDLMKSWNTGHEGGIATIHANNIEGALQRLEDLTQEVLPAPASRLISQVVHSIVFMKKTPAGNIAVEAVAELTGFDEKGYQLKTIFSN